MHPVVLRSCVLTVALLAGCAGRRARDPLPAPEPPASEADELAPAPRSAGAPDGDAPPEAEPDGDAAPEGDASPQAEPDTEPDTEPEADAAPEAEPDAGPEVERDPVAATEPRVEPEPEAPRAEPEVAVDPTGFEWPEPSSDLDLLLSFPPDSVEDQIPPAVTDVTYRLPAPLGDPDPAASHTVFVRLVSATLGGDFDSSGAEEVVISLEGERSKTRLARHVLGLPSNTVTRFELREDSAWVELGELRFDVHVVDDDATGVERMTDSVHEVALDPEGLGPDPVRLKVELERIRGESWGFFKAKRTIDLGGAELELDALRVPRQPLDAAARRAAAACFPRAAFARDARSARELREQIERLVSFAEDGARTLQRSTHTAQREVLERLVRRAVLLAEYARSAVLETPGVREAYYPKLREELAEAQREAAEPRLDADFARVDAALDAPELGAGHDAARAAMDALQAASEALGDEGPEDFERNWAISSWSFRARDVLKSLEAGGEARRRYRTGRAAFLAELDALRAE